ncbi:hypothetical protein P1X15_07095 [Runella sp. MFBS21]|uniref:hypothetical protein n=1 Tax=Runella sp. MFBS21 TaxID=3034018 RepID=UPI0023F85B7A|nr:hypothetical protein [Runella sp. MFBS21]MDF7817352.1 hypothetical protein [Runella sp. MFBS21]
MKSLTLGTAHLLLPQHWGECTQTQLIEGLELQLLLQEKANDADGAMVLLQALACLLGKFTPAFWESLSIDQRFEIIEALRWATVEKATQLPFRSFRHRGRQYLLPRENFADTSGIELAMANIHYLAFSEGHPTRIFDLIATIARPCKWHTPIRRLLPSYDGDDRQTYNSLKAERRAKRLGSLRLGMCIAILQYWENQNNRFYEIYREIYEGGNGRTLFHNGEGWIATLEDVASAGVHGNFEKVCETNAHTLWMWLKHRKVLLNEQERLAEN